MCINVNFVLCMNNTAGYASLISLCCVYIRHLYVAASVLAFVLLMHVLRVCVCVVRGKLTGSARGPQHPRLLARRMGATHGDRLYFNRQPPHTFSVNGTQTQHTVSD